MINKFKKKFRCLSLLAARHCLASIYQVNVSSAVRPYSFVLHAQSCLPSAVFHAHVKSPLISSNLPISTLSAHLSRLRVGQYFAICRLVLVRQCGSDNVEATLFILSITTLDNSDNVEATTCDSFRIP